MIEGIEIFSKYLKEFTDNFIIIGGTACSMLYKEAGLTFRRTKDIDLILTTSDSGDSSNFRKRFYEFIKDGGYSIFQREERFHYYRFQAPTQNEFPFMIELFSQGNFEDINNSERKYTTMDEDEKYHLSAIIMAKSSYEMIVRNSEYIDGLPVAKSLVVIVLKALAWKDMTRRKDINNERIDSKDIRKHRNDILRLHEILKDSDTILIEKELSRQISGILREMYETVTLADVKNVIGRSVKNKDAFINDIISKI